MILFLEELARLLRRYPNLSAHRAILSSVQVRRSRAFGDDVIVSTWKGEDPALEEVREQLYEECSS